MKKPHNLTSKPLAGSQQLLSTRLRHNDSSLNQVKRLRLRRPSQAWTSKLCSISGVSSSCTAWLVHIKTIKPRCWLVTNSNTLTSIRGNWWRRAGWKKIILNFILIHSQHWELSLKTNGRSRDIRDVRVLNAKKKLNESLAHSVSHFYSQSVIIY